MNEKGQVKVDLIADPAGYRQGTQEALAEQRQFNARFQEQERTAEAERNRRWQAHQEQLKQAKVSQADLNREAEAFVNRIKDQAATLGMSRTEVERYRASQLALTTEQRKQVEASVAQIDAFERQQASLQRLTAIAVRASAAVGAVATAITLMSVRAAAEAERSEARFAGMHRATGMSSGFSMGELTDMVNDLERRTPYSDEKIRDAMAQLMSFRMVSGDTFRETMVMATGLSELLGRDLSGAVQMLGKAFEDPVNGLGALQRAGVKFSPTQKDLIKDLVEHGRSAEALAIVLEELRRRGFATLADEVNKPGGYTRSISSASKATGELLEALGRTSAMKGAVTGALDAYAHSLNSIKQLIESGTWYERLLASAPFGAGFAYTMMRTPQGGPLAASDSPEARAAREAAADNQWQRDFDAQQRGLRTFIQKEEEKLAKEAAREAERIRNARLHANTWTGAPEFGPMGDQKAMDREALEAELAYARGLQSSRLFEEENLATRNDALTDQAIAIRKSAEAVRAGLDPWSAYNEKMRTLNELLEAGAISHQEYAIAAARAAETMDVAAAKQTDSFNDLKSAIDGFGKASARTAAEMLVDWKFSTDSITQLLRQLAIEFVQMQLYRNMMQPALNTASNFNWGGLFGGGSTGGGSTGGGAVGDFPTTTPMGHSGGIVSSLHQRRTVNPAVFANAPRLHDGGLALSHDEVPIIALRNEEVLTRDDPRHRLNGGGVQVHIHNNAAGAEATASVSDDGMRIDVVIEQVRDALGREIGQGVGLAEPIGKRFGLNPAAGSYR